MATKHSATKRTMMILVLLFILASPFNVPIAKRSFQLHHRTISSSFPQLSSERVLFGKSRLEMSTAIEAPEPDRVPIKETAQKIIPTKIFKKIFPLGFMLFFILFNYTILRDTKDVLVITAPNSGAEIIPFLKTYVNLPASIGFTFAYNALVNKMSPDKAFYVVMTSFISFFAAFAGIICELLNFISFVIRCDPVSSLHRSKPDAAAPQCCCRLALHVVTCILLGRLPLNYST